MDPDDSLPGWADAELILAVAEADTCALEGKVAIGQQILARGLHATEQYVAAGEPWSRHLQDRWRRALYEYLRRHRRTGN